MWGWYTQLGWRWKWKIQRDREREAKPCDPWWGRAFISPTTISSNHESLENKGFFLYKYNNWTNPHIQFKCSKFPFLFYIKLIRFIQDHFPNFIPKKEMGLYAFNSSCQADPQTAISSYQKSAICIINNSWSAKRPLCSLCWRNWKEAVCGSNILLE